MLTVLNIFNDINILFVVWRPYDTVIFQYRPGMADVNQKCM